MESSVMRSAKGDEVVRIVLTALGAGLQMMQIDMDCMPAPRNHAAAVITPQYQTSNGGRDALHGARWSGQFVRCRSARVGVDIGLLGRGAGLYVRAHVSARPVDATEVLRIARRHLDDLGPYPDQLAISLHGPALAVLAHG